MHPTTWSIRSPADMVADYSATRCTIASADVDHLESALAEELDRPTALRNPSAAEWLHAGLIRARVAHARYSCRPLHGIATVWGELQVGQAGRCP